MIYLNTERRLVTMPDPRLAERERILQALKDEPLTLDEAKPLLEQLSELAADIERNPPEAVEFGSAEWFEMIQEIPLKGAQS